MHDLTRMMVEGEEEADQDLELPPIQPGEVPYRTPVPRVADPVAYGPFW